MISVDLSELSYIHVCVSYVLVEVRLSKALAVTVAYRTAALVYVYDLHVMCHSDILYINTLTRVAAELSSDVYFEPVLMQQIH